jgi:nitroreductase
MMQVVRSGSIREPEGHSLDVISVSAAVERRRSVRAFLPTPIEQALIAEVLKKAMRAPSGGNLQPWRLYVLNGDSMTRFNALLSERIAENAFGEAPEYAVYPPSLKEPYRSRRFAVGEAMYERLQIPRSDKLGRLRWFQNNDRFFGAPAAIFCFVDRIMERPQWSDLGMFLQTAMLLFQERGLDTCPHEAWSRWPKTVSRFVGAPDELMLFCGVAVGRADPDAPVNQLRAERADPEEIMTFL